MTVSLLLALSSVRAQRAPADTSDDYIVRVTQRWGASAFIGALPTRPMGADDVELRVWGGYGLGSTRGVILRRTDGRWQAWRAQVVRCVLEISKSHRSSAPFPTDSMLAAEARRNCSRPAAGGGSYMQADTLALTQVDARNAAFVWDSVVRAGVLDLPPRIRRNWIMVDGFAIVIETRHGASYRASRFEAIGQPETTADTAARQIYRTIKAEFGSN